MSQDVSQDKVFPLSNALAIIPSKLKDVPEKVDLIYTVIVDAPGEPRGQFGPVKAWKDKELGEEIWRIAAPHSLCCIPSVKERMLSLVEHEAWSKNDPTASILSGMVKKNDYSWDSLVQAYDANDLWARNVIGMLQETISQTSMLWWVALPSMNTDSAQMLISLSEVSTKRRKELKENVEKFMIASSVFEEYEDRSHNSSARKNAQSQLDCYARKLAGYMGDDVFLAEKHKKESDDGTIFFL